MAAFRPANCLFGEVVDHFNDLANIVGAGSERIDDLARGGWWLIRFKPSSLFHGAMPLCTSSRERLEISSRTLAVSPRAGWKSPSRRWKRTFHSRLKPVFECSSHVLHVHAHLVHGAGDFIDCGSGLQIVASRFVGRTATCVERLPLEAASRTLRTRPRSLPPCAERRWQVCRLPNVGEPRAQVARQWPRKRKPFPSNT